MELRKDLEYTGAIFQTTIDSEVIAYHIARERLKSKTVEEAVGRACRKLKGAYSLVVMSPRNSSVQEILLVLNRSALENVIMLTFLHLRAAHWRRSEQILYVMSCRGRL